LFAASMVAVCSAASGGLRGSKQDAMKEVSGPAKHYTGLKPFKKIGPNGCMGGCLHPHPHPRPKGPKDLHSLLRKIDKVILHDEDRSGEQDAMKEVSGTSKGLLGNVEHLVDKGAKEAYHIANKSEPFILHDENRSGEQDAMKEVSGTSKGFLPTVVHVVDKGLKGGEWAANVVGLHKTSMWFHKAHHILIR